MVEKVVASTFHRFMSSGRTSPMLASCSRIGKEDVDVVVKLNGAMDFGSRGALWELAAALMAKRMQIICPTPFLVEITSDFATVVADREPTQSSLIERSIGENFGCQMLNGAIVWANDMGIPSSMQEDASKVFVFDALIQNPDRTAVNPNLLIRADTITIIDHESAFSFLTTILKPSKAWGLGKGDYMERHALNYSLGRSSISWQKCWEALSSLDESCFQEIRENVPEAWNGSNDIDQIQMHVEAVLAHRIDFETELRGKIL